MNLKGLEMSNIRKNQINRELKKEKRKKKARVKLFIGGLVASMVITVAYFSAYKENNASADTANIILNQDKHIKDKEGYDQAVVGYKKINQNTPIYESVVVNPRIAFRLKEGDYVAYYGQVNTWAKVENNNRIGYVQTDKLNDLGQGRLLVRNGQLMDGKKYKFPKDFKTNFDMETENSLMVMLEAMRRGGLDIDVAHKSLDTKDDLPSKDRDDKSPYDYPSFDNHTLRTGLAVEFKLKEETNQSFADTDQGRWLRDNAHRYGFILRYPKGDEELTGFYHNDKIYRFVGVDIATDMYENDMTLEEYFGL